MSLITIVIPTHNRQAYAAAGVRKIVSVLPSAQIIVSDSSAADQLRAMLPIDDTRFNVIYLRPELPIDVVAHFEFALSHATGRYVMFLGDDDCVGPGLEEIASWAEREGIDAISSYDHSFIANYFWPGVRSRFYGDGYASSLFVHEFSGNARRLDGPAAIRETLRNFGSGLGRMPRIYHGLVSLELVQKVRQRHGRLFGGVTPDIYSATLISGYARNAWQVDYPFCLPGGSPASTAGTGAAGTDLASLEEHPHTAAFKDLLWDSQIPAFYAPYIVWGYSQKKAVEALSQRDFTPNLARIYALALMRNPEQRAKIAHAFAAARVLGVGPIDVARELVREAAFQAKRYATRAFAPRAGGRAKRFEGLSDIGRGYDRLERLIRERGIVLNLPKGAMQEDL